MKINEFAKKCLLGVLSAILAFALAPAVALADAVDDTANASTSKSYVEDEVLVGFVDDLGSEDEVYELAGRYGFGSVRILSFHDWKGGKVALFKGLPEGLTVLSAIDVLNADPLVRIAEPNDIGSTDDPVVSDAERLYGDLVPGIDYVEDEVLVGFVDDLGSEDEVYELAGRYGFGSVRILSFHDWKGGKVALFKGLPEGLGYLDMLTLLNCNNMVNVAEPNFIGTTDMTVNDNLASSQWYLDTVGAYAAWDYATCDGNNPSGETITVAVLDTGIDLSHEDLYANVLNGYAWDAVSGTALTGDLAMHGSHVAGIISAVTNNARGVSGVSYNANVLPVNVYYMYDSATGKCYYDVADLIAGYEYLLNDVPLDELNVRVVNFSGSGPNYSSNLEAQINEAAAAGIITVASAGNNASSDARYPSDFEACVSVIATDSENARASFSNYGIAKDISAPGVGILSTIPGDAYVTMNGTSMAAPIVSATLALEFAADPDLTNDQAKYILYHTAVDLGTTGRDADYGWGLVNARNAAEYALRGPWERLAGTDRFFTSQAISLEGWDDDSCDTVVLTTGENYADALSGSALAGLYDAPVILTAGSALSVPAANEITRLGATHVIILGSTASVSATTEASVAALVGASNVERVYGATRCETSLAICNRGVGNWGDTAIIATGFNSADSLSASAWAYAAHAPILMAGQDGTLIPGIQSVISSGTFDKVVILGGTDKVTTATEAWLVSQLGSSNVMRISGSDRYVTSASFAEWATGNDGDAAFQSSTPLSYDGMGVASGADACFADGVAGGPLCGSNGGVLVLAPNVATGNIAVDIAGNHSNEIHYGYVFGGTPSLSDDVFNALKIACLS